MNKNKAEVEGNSEKTRRNLNESSLLKNEQTKKEKEQSFVLYALCVLISYGSPVYKRAENKP